MKNTSIRLLIVLLWSWAPLLALDVRPMLRGSPATTSSFTAQTAIFNSSDYIRNDNTLVGVNDGYAFTVAFMAKIGTATGVEDPIFAIANTTTPRLRVYKSTTDKIVVTAFSTGGTQKVTLVSTNTFFGSSTWQHFYLCVDRTSAANTKIYVNGVEETFSTETLTGNDGNPIDMNTGTKRCTIGGDSNNTSLTFFSGSLAEFVFYDTYHDVPSAFYDTATSKPKSIGSDGSTPTGAAPDIYLSLYGSGDDWRIDSSGNANDFTVSGALTADTPP